MDSDRLLILLSDFAYECANAFRDLCFDLFYRPITEYDYIGKLLELFGVPGNTTLVELFLIVGLPLIIVYSIVKWLVGIIP